MDKKAAIVLGCNTHWTPFYFYYEGLLVSEGVGFDLIIWNREGIIENVQAESIYEYKVRDISDNKDPKKVFKFIGFSSFVKKLLKQNRYDKVLFLGTYGAAPCFCANYLKKSYNKKYIIDIRDYQHEWFTPYYLLEEKAIKNSFFTAISSDGFKQFLPEWDYKIVHNIDPKMDKFIDSYEREGESSPIRISFIGHVRYLDWCHRLLLLFKNDMRFRIQFFGAGANSLISFCEANQITNVELHDRFNPDDTILFYNKTDIVNNLYGNEDISLTTALSNKLYFSLALSLPILVCEKTFMATYAEEHRIGVVFENTKDFPDKLYSWYENNKGRTQTFEEAWKRVSEDNSRYENAVISFVKNNTIKG